MISLGHECGEEVVYVAEMTRDAWADDHHGTRLNFWRAFS